MAIPHGSLPARPAIQSNPATQPGQASELSQASQSQATRSASQPAQLPAQPARPPASQSSQGQPSQPGQPQATLSASPDAEPGLPHQANWGVIREGRRAYFSPAGPAGRELWVLLFSSALRAASLRHMFSPALRALSFGPIFVPALRAGSWGRICPLRPCGPAALVFFPFRHIFPLPCGPKFWVYLLPRPCGP